MVHEVAERLEKILEESTACVVLNFGFLGDLNGMELLDGGCNGFGLCARWGFRRRSSYTDDLI